MRTQLLSIATSVLSISATVSHAQISPGPDQTTSLAPLESRERYRYTSLEDASDTDLLRFMAHGKSEFDRDAGTAIRNRLPDNFWTTDPKTAALELINENRTDAHRAAYKITIDNRTKANPPPRCTIAFSDSSARCYNAVDAHYFLRVDPEESYLAYARSWSEGVVFYNAVHDQPAFDLRLCPIRYEDARRIAEVIWWLDRVRCVRVQDDTASAYTTDRTFSTADGTGKLTLRSANRTLIEHADSLSAWNLSDRWSEEKDQEALLNFAAYLMEDAIPARLGKEWLQFKPENSQDVNLRGASAPVYEAQEKKRLSALAGRFLDCFTLKHDKISFAIVAEAARLAGTFAIDSTAERLRAIESALPPPGPRRRTYEEVSAEQNQLPYPFDVKDRKKKMAIERRRAALDAETHSIVYDLGADRADHVREITALAKKQIDAANNAEQPQAWATSKADGSQWAFQRLAQIDRTRYAEVIESIMRQVDGEWARQFFDELAKIDPPRAAAIARRLPPDKRDALAISAFLLLRDAEEVPDETTRIATIIQILHDPKTGWEERSRAIDLLVPDESPLRYAGPEVDEALIKLFEPEQADKGGDFTVRQACRALARRGRTDQFDRIAQQLDATQDASTYSGILGALALLAQADPSRFNRRVIAVLKPHFSQTNKDMNAILWTIWADDLRELRPELERLATLSADVYEDRKARGYGGQVSPVAGRFHFARKIVGLWSESDPPTRARLLIALALTEAHEFVGEPQPELVARMKGEMARAGHELRADAKQMLSSFLDRMATEPPLIDDVRLDPETCRKVTAFTREAMGL